MLFGFQVQGSFLFFFFSSSMLHNSISQLRNCSLMLNNWFNINKKCCFWTSHKLYNNCYRFHINLYRLLNTSDITWIRKPNPHLSLLLQLKYHSTYPRVCPQEDQSCKIAVRETYMHKGCLIDWIHVTYCCTIPKILALDVE